MMIYGRAVRVARLQGQAESVMKKLGEGYKLTPGVASQVCAIGLLGYKFSAAFIQVLTADKALQGLFSTGLLLREITSGSIFATFEIEKLNRGLRYANHFMLDREKKTFALKVETC